MQKREDSFTLVELLIGTFLLAVVITSLYFVFWKAYSAWIKGSSRLQVYQNTRSCLDAMSREIKSSFISKSNPNLVFKGNEHHLFFTSTFNEAGESAEYDLCEIEYSLTHLKLQRRIKTSLDSNPGKGGCTATLGFPINDLIFSYYNGKNWQKSWDSTMKTLDCSDDALPQAVEITLSSQAKGEAPLTFSTVVYLPQRI